MEYKETKKLITSEIIIENYHRYRGFPYEHSLRVINPSANSLIRKA